MFSLNNTQLKASKTLLYIYSGAHLLAVFAILLAAIPPFEQIVLSSVIVVSYLFNIHETILLTSATSITAISWNADDKSIFLRQRNGDKLKVLEVKQRMSHTYAVYLLLKVQDRYLPVPILVMHDSCSRDEFRRVKVLLKFAKVEAANSNQN